jgi:hypothetical protein
LPTERFKTQHSSQIHKDMQKVDLHLVTRGTLGSPSLFARLAGPHAASHQPAGQHQRKGQHRARLQNTDETKSTDRSHITCHGWVSLAQIEAQVSPDRGPICPRRTLCNHHRTGGTSPSRHRHLLMDLRPRPTRPRYPCPLPATHFLP